LGALTGVLPNRHPPVRIDEPLPRVDAKPAQQGTCAVCGTIEAIRLVEVLDEAGAAGGASEPKARKDASEANPKVATSVLDALSEALTGNEAAKGVRKRQAYRVTVRMDDGSFRAISLSSPPAFAVGDKVRVVEGRLVRS
jgi:outer membrane lipoprotein SlyB